MQAVKQSKIIEGAEVSQRMSLYVSMTEANILLKCLKAIEVGCSEYGSDHTLVDYVDAIFNEHERLLAKRCQWTIERSL